MIRRSGTTLIEVLVAIFVTAIGLLGLLALFPLGAVNMAQAIKDSRTAQAAANAVAVAAAQGIRNDSMVLRDNWDNVLGDDFFVRAQKGPNGAIIRPRADPNGPSYPVYVDPIGVTFGLGQTLGVTNNDGLYHHGGYNQDQSIPRRSVSFVTNSVPSTRTAIRWFTLLDDLTFPKDVPVLGGVNVQREGRYSWAYMLRRPQSSDASVVDLTVVVYSGRPTFGQGETVYGPVTFDPTSNVVRVSWDAKTGQEKPAVRAGGWILDATMVRRVRTGLTPTFEPDPQGLFYRVVNVGEPGVQNDGKPYVDLELQTKPRHRQITDQGVLVVLDGVAEVFEKGPGWRP